MATNQPSAKRRLADQLLDGGLIAYVSRRRTEGMSWRLISLEIRADADLDIHPDTLRLWIESEQVAA